MKIHTFLLLLLLFVSTFALAQKPEIINSGEILTKSMELADSGDFKGALNLLQKVNRNDTNYVDVLLKKAIVCRADSQYNEGVNYCKQALLVKADHELEADIYTIYGNLLLDMGKHDEAMKIFEDGIVKFPSNSLMYFNKGVVYLRKEKPELAEPWFQKTLLINPYMYSAHYHLGLAAVLQGKIVPAYISYMSYLLFSPKGKFAGSSINMLQQISVSTEEVVKLKDNRKSYPNANYQAVEDVLFSKIALNKSYIPLTEVDDPISRQIQAVVEKIEYSDEDADFWIQYYVPFLKKTYADKKFNVFIHHLFSNVKIPAIEAYVSKNKKQIDAFTTEAGGYFDLIHATREIAWKKRDTVSNRYFFDSGNLIGKGGISKGGKTLNGAWEGYYAGGNIKSKGMYNAAGQRTGSWTWLNANGTVKAKENYLNGKLEGKQEYYFFNGNKSSDENYVNGQLDGLATVFHYGGGVKRIINYKADKQNGEEKAYYTSGDLSYVKNFTAGQLNGSAKEYFKNRKLKSDVQYVNGKAEGNYKQFNDKGMLIAEGNFLKDAVEGDWKYYYDDGKIKQSSQMKNGEENGLHQEYYPNGQLSKTYNAVKGKVNGELVEYYKNGKVLSRQTYANGGIIKAAYLDQTGATLSSLVKSGEGSKMVSYDHHGFKKASFNYDKTGLLNGPDTIFYSTGKINQICNYKDDLVDGEILTYYPNGKKKAESAMKAGETNGYVINYYINGNRESEGWVVDGQSQGSWSYYHENGKLSSIQHFFDGELDGFKDEYYPNGQKSVEYRYHIGWVQEITHYDELGKVIGTDDLSSGQGKFRLLYPNGKLMAESTFKNGDYHGSFKTYYFDGSPEQVFYYKFGQLDSTYVSYQHGGVKSFEGKYNLGEREGVWKFYDIDGKLSRESAYSGGMLNGPYTSYHANGKPEFVTVIKDDLLEGHAKTYDTKGALAYQVWYDGDLAISYTFNDATGKLKNEITIDPKKGEMKSFYANGKPSRECFYIGGEKNGHDKLYYENGMLSAEKYVEYNISEGPSKSYYENGKVKDELIYLSDNLHGTCKSYNENGTLKRETNYEHGVIQGDVKVYDGNGKLLQTKSYEQGILKSVKNG